MFAEMFHESIHMAQSQLQDVKLAKFGRVTTYDPAKNAVKVLIFQDFSTDDEPAETEWIPLGTIAVGDGWGIQYAPVGGATADNGEGELCVVLTMQRNSGLFVTAHLLFDADNQQPPGAGEDSTSTDTGWSGDPEGTNQLQGGELVAKFQQGSFVKFYKNGDVQLYTANDLYVYAQNDAEIHVREGDCNITTDTGDITLNSASDVNITSAKNINLNATEAVNISWGTNLNLTGA